MATAPRIAVLTAGAGGMFCGSCMHDNSLVAALIKMGVDACLIPMYTPIRTDTEDVSLDRVFFGGINVYLQQHSRLSRFVPGFIERWLDHPGFVRWVTSRNMQTDASQLGDLTLSMLRGESGRQRKEVQKLARWLGESLQPSLIVFSNLLIAGSAPSLKRQLSVPILVTLQGDDVFLDALPERDRQRAIDQMQTVAESVDGFLTHSEYYRDYMSSYLGLSKDRFLVIPLGVDTEGFSPAREHQGPLTIGYLARLTPEKGLHLLCAAFTRLREREGTKDAQLAVAGWSGGRHAGYGLSCLNEVRQECGAEAVRYVGEVDRNQKIEFLRSIDVLSVPCPYREPKGLYVLEALATGVPVVQPNHGAFPELIASTGGGRLFQADDVDSLADNLYELLTRPEVRSELGQAGYASVREKHSAETAARRTWDVYREFLSR